MANKETGTRGKALTMHDVARAAGVAHGTVSNVLNDLPSVTPGNREKVLAAIDAIGYVRNESARQLRMGRSGTIGMILLDASNPYFADVAMGAEEGAATAGYTVFTCNSNGLSTREAAYLNVLEENRVDGIVLACASITAELSAQLAAIQRRGTPVVIVGHRFQDPTFNSVTGDNELGGALAASHLLDLGYKRLTFITGPLDLEGFAERLSGAKAAMASHGLPPDALQVTELTEHTIAAGATAVRNLLQSSEPPSALFCANDLLAIGALQAATALNVSVPEDLAIIGYDDIVFAAGAAIPLTSVRQPSLELGRKAVELLTLSIEQTSTPPRQIVLEPKIQPRRSTARTL